MMSSQLLLKTFILSFAVLLTAASITGCHHRSNLQPGSLKTVYGQFISPLKTDGKKSHVLFFISRKCRVSQEYIMEIEDISKTYGDERFNYYIIYTDENISSSDVRRHMHQYRILKHAYIDRDRQLIHELNIETTPTVVVILPNQLVGYQGRIDDRFIALDKKRPFPKRQDLRYVLDLIASNKNITLKSEPAIGCRIRQ